jgi:alkyl hydroperoxide reductase subunit AhpC
LFRQYNGQFEEKGAQVLGISCDSHHSHRMWSNSLGNLPYPLLSDFHPHGEMCKSYALFNEERGVPIRAVVIVDKDGVVRFRKEYAPPTLPDPADILAELEKLG